MFANNSSAATETHNGGGGSIGGGGGGDTGTNPDGGFNDEDMSRIEVDDNGGGGGRRWPRQETLELLRIRSEMEVSFRDSNLKGPLWEEVSRKMAQLGHRRSGKKCKEKFENVYKYHKRTKDGRASKSDGKTYRFFEQLQALEKKPSSQPLLFPALPSSFSRSQQIHIGPEPSIHENQVPTTAISTTLPVVDVADVTLTSVTSAVAMINQVSFSPPSLNSNALMTDSSININHPQGNPFQSSSHLNMSSSLPSDDQFTSSSTSSDEDIKRKHKSKRKLKDYFEGLLHNIVEKQEGLHKKFLETMEKRDRERMIKEEAWRVQEMARMNRELEILNQERSMAAAKDAAILSFLQKYSAQENIKTSSPPPHPPTSDNNVSQIQLSLPLLPPQNSQPPPQPPPPISQITTPPPPLQPPQLALSTRNEGNGGENFMTQSSSRWPKAEIEALIKLRSNLDLKYLDNCPKGPLWEEISAQMSKLGYNRNPKRCKEKWENINKYFKKVKESNKRRHEDSKTCPYFHQLDALYKEKAKLTDHNTINNPFQISYPNAIKPETPVPIMARPEQQWPIQMHGSAMDEDEDHDTENFDENDDDDEEDHEMVTDQRQDSMSVATTTGAE